VPLPASVPRIASSEARKRSCYQRASQQDCQHTHSAAHDLGRLWEAQPPCGWIWPALGMLGSNLQQHHNYGAATERTLNSHDFLMAETYRGLGGLYPLTTKVSGSIFQPLILSVGCDPIECLSGKRASTVRSSSGNSET